MARIKYGLLTLIIASLLAGCIMMVILWRDPWIVDVYFPISQAGCLCFSPNDNLCLVSRPNIIYAFDLTTAKEVSKINLDGFGDIRYIAPVVGGAKYFIAFNSRYGQALIASDLGSYDIIKRIRGDHNFYFDTTRDGLMVVTADVFGFDAGIYEVPTLQEKNMLECIQSDDIFSNPEIMIAHFAPDGKLVVGVQEDGKAVVWDVSTLANGGGNIHQAERKTNLIGDPIRGRLLSGDHIVDAAFSQDGRNIYCLVISGETAVYDANDYKLVKTYSCPKSKSVKGWYMNRIQVLDSKRIIVWNTWMGLRILDASSGKQLWELSDREITSHYSLAVSHKNNMIALGEKSGVSIWRRRFPEWWWGHLFRPEVWAAIIVCVGLVWSIVRDQRYFKALAAKRTESAGGATSTPADPKPQPPALPEK